MGEAEKGETWACKKFSDEVEAWQSKDPSTIESKAERRAWLKKGKQIAKATVEPCDKDDFKVLKAKRTKLKEKRNAIKKSIEGKKRELVRLKKVLKAVRIQIQKTKEK